MTPPENERLAVVETKIDGLQTDMTTVKADVKKLLSFQSSFGWTKYVLPAAAIVISIVAILK